MGGPDRGAPGPPHRLEGQRLDARVRRRRPPTPTPASPPRPRSARRSRRSGRTPQGVPISAILFGGRRATRGPAGHRVLRLAARRLPRRRTSPPRGTAAAENKVGELRRDPFAMLPFCGYNMGDYFGPLAGDRPGQPTPAKLPRIYYVNWFRKDDERQVRLAGLRREQPRAEVDRRAARRQRPRASRPRSAGSRPRTPSTPTGLDLAERRARPAAHRRPRGLARGGRPDPGPPTRPSATTCRRSCGTSTRPWWSAWGSAGPRSPECGRPRRPAAGSTPTFSEAYALTVAMRSAPLGSTSERR